MLKIPYQIQVKSFKTLLGKLFLLSLLLFSYSSCSDQGCIEADDFGEYQQQVLTVKANYADENCDYDSTKSTEDATQGSGLKVCFTSGNIGIDPGDGSGVITSTAGCSGFSDNILARNLCIEQCRQECINSGSSNSGQAEPDWEATSSKKSGQNSGVTLTPGAKIEIRAVGKVILGEDRSTQPIFVRSSSLNYGLQSNNADFSESFIDVRVDNTKTVKFSGKWRDFSDSENSGNITIGGDSSSNNMTERQAAFNGARRIAAYLIPHPAGYNFDTRATTEKLGTKGTPLFADTDLWNCTYDDTDTLDQSSCGSLPYNASTGYPETDSTLAATLYGITSQNQGNNLGTIGGAIRWDNDGMINWSYDPFPYSSTLNCKGGNCVDTIPVENIVGDLSLEDRRIIQNDNNYPIKIAFKHLGEGPGIGSCTSEESLRTYAITVKKGETELYSRNIVALERNDSWNNADFLTLDTGEYIEFAQNNTSYSRDNSGVNCARSIVYKSAPIKEIKINKSGFVSFTNLANTGTSGANCPLQGRIVNPGGTKIDDPDNDFDNDFYEYESFSALSPTDPLANLNVPTSVSTVINSPYSKNWSDKVFVRKGQIIRIDPTSWDNSWDPGAGNFRQCGIGMVMKIEERPAFLCRGTAADEVSNPQCNVSTDESGNLICQRRAGECYDETTNSYCPMDESSEIHNCQDDYVSDVCYNAGPPLINSTSCGNCKSKKDANGSLLPTTQIDLNQCYNLENYTGKVSNINPITGFTPQQLNDEGFAKGAEKLNTFNGLYGNFGSFIKTNENEPAAYSNNEIYSLSGPVIFSSSGRLKFLILDGSDFNTNMIPDYVNNGTSGGSYNGSNGYKIDLSGRQEFSNGQWLEAILCQENNNDGSTICSSSSRPINLSGQPKVVEIEQLTDPGAGYQSTSYYQFDPFGSILRISNSNATGPSPSDNIASEVQEGNNFYRHAYEYYPNDEGMTDEVKNKISRLRLTFKIKDPEIGNCNISNPIQDCSTNNSNCNGIRAENNFYDRSVSSNIGAICTATPGSGSTDCQKQYFCANKYHNNSGSYRVIVKVKNEKSNISDIVNQVVSPVIEIMDGKQDPSRIVKNCKTSDPTLRQNCYGNICNGLVSNNPFYYPTDSENVGVICNKDDLSPGPSEGQCKKQYYCASQESASMGQAERVYKAVIDNPKFKAIVQIIIILMITFYGVGYLMGVSEFSQGEIITRIIKIAVVYLFVSPEGWDWFNQIFVNFFKNGTDYVTFIMASAFDRSPEIQNAIANQDFHDKSILFSGIDKVFGMFFSSAVQKKISALLFASIFGWLYLIIIYLSFMLYVYAVANAVLLYLTAQVFISILFVLAPLFFLTLLFNQTKEMFDKWLSELISFSLQQIFLLITLAFFNMMMYEIIKLALGYRICWDDVWIINIYITRIKLLSFWTVASLPPRLNPQSEVGNIGNPEGIPSIFSILFIWIIASLMHKFITFMTDLAAAIGGGIKASQMSEGIKATANKVNNEMATMRKQYIDKKAHSALQSVDRALFDSGAKAEADRKAAKQKDTKDIKDRSALVKAGKAGVDEFKKKNAEALSKMTQAEQQQALTKARDQAINKKAKDMNMSDSEKSRLMDKTSKLGNATTVGGLAQELFKKRNNLRKPASDREVNTALSGTQMRAALKNSDEEGKKQLAEAVKSGNLRVKVSNKEYAKDQAISGLKSINSGARSLARGAFKTAKDPKQAAKNARQSIEKAARNPKQSAQEVGKAAQNAGVSALNKTGNVIDRAIDPAKKPMISALKGMANVIPGARTSEYEKARKQLVSEDAIKDKRAGFKWSMSKEDKKLVKERVKQNKEEQSLKYEGGNTKSDVNFVAKYAKSEKTSPLELAENRKQQLEKERESAEQFKDSVLEGDDNTDNNANIRLERVKNEERKINALLNKLKPSKPTPNEEDLENDTDEDEDTEPPTFIKREETSEREFNKPTSKKKETPKPTMESIAEESDEDIESDDSDYSPSDDDSVASEPESQGSIASETESRSRRRPKRRRAKTQVENPDTKKYYEGSYSDSDDDV